MRKLSLENYTYSARTQQGTFKLMTYQFKDALINVITHNSLGLNGPEMLEIDPVVEKIEKAGLEVILTDEDYRKMAENFKRFRGFSNNDRQFIKRFYNCPEVPDDGEKVIDIEFTKN